MPPLLKGSMPQWHLFVNLLLWFNLYVFSDLSGDPLYIAGGQPKLFDSEFVDESYAHDGYATDICFISFMISYD